jgi:hypothetical protein
MQNIRIEGTPEEVKAKLRLEYLRGEIEAERMSYGETLELRDLARFIEPGDVVLEEWAGYCEEHRGLECPFCN